MWENLKTLRQKKMLLSFSIFKKFTTAVAQPTNAEQWFFVAEAYRHVEQKDSRTVELQR